MEFLTQQVFQIAGFPIVVWHVIVAVAVVVLLVVLFVGLCQPKKKKQKTAPQVTEPTDEPTEEIVVTIEEDGDDIAVDVVADDTDDTVDTVEPADVDQPTEGAVAETPTEQPAETVTETPTAKKPTVKNYHISLRPDGKWQVKLSKGGKAIKLFRTQAEAIAFAKSRAKSQDGHITIHKVDGKIRKQKY